MQAVASSGVATALRSIARAADAARRVPRTLIVTADDFGRDLAFNEAIERSHRDGILTCASLMVAEPAAADAVTRAQALPELGVGLHLTLVDGRPMLPPDRISALVGRDGRFPSDPVRQGIRLFFSRAARRQLRAEVRAQFEAFRATGLRLDHVNGHHHFHIHPLIRREILALAGAFGVRAVRVPVPPAAGRRSFEEWSNAWLGARLRRRLAAANIAANDEMYGLRESGHLTSATILDALRRPGSGVAEIYCHPVSRAWRPGDPWPADYDGVGELAALLDPAVRQAVEKGGIRLATFATALG
jgi:hopanoid biosynthesis associated protein HpnK